MASKASTLPAYQPICDDPAAGEYLDFPVLGRKGPFVANREYFIEALINGISLGVHEAKERATFHTSFSRFCAVRGLRMSLHLRQVKPDLWLLIPRKGEAQSLR